MNKILMYICLILGFAGVCLADDYTQQQILNEMRDYRYEQQYNRTLDSWTDSIRRSNRQIQENNRRMDREERGYDSWDTDYESWQPDPDGGLVIPGGHFE